MEDVVSKPRIFKDLAHTESKACMHLLCRNVGREGSTSEKNFHLLEVLFNCTQEEFQTA